MCILSNPDHIWGNLVLKGPLHSVCNRAERTSDLLIRSKRDRHTHTRACADTHMQHSWAVTLWRNSHFWNNMVFSLCKGQLPNIHPQINRLLPPSPQSDTAIHLRQDKTKLWVWFWLCPQMPLVVLEYAYHPKSTSSAITNSISGWHCSILMWT